MAEAEGSKIELEIAGILLGLLFVVITILATIPDDLLQTLQLVTLKNIWFQTVGLPDFMVKVSLGCFFLMLGALAFYLVYNGMKIKFLLMIGRTFLMIGILFFTLLSVSFTGVVIMRLKSSAEAVPYMNPMFGVVYVFSIIVTIIILFVLWVRALQSFKDWWKAPKEESIRSKKILKNRKRESIRLVF